MGTLSRRWRSEYLAWLMAPALLWGALSAYGAPSCGTRPRAEGGATSHWAVEMTQPASNLALFERQDASGNLYFSGFADPGAIGGYDVVLYELSPDGTLQWSKAYGTTADDVGSVGLLTSDGGFLLIGNSYASFGTSPAEASWVCKLDASGNIQWQDAFTTTSSGPPTIQEAYVVPTGYLLVAAYYQSPSPGGFTLIELGTTGNVLWQQSYVSPTLSYAPPNVKVFSDGSFVAGGSASAANGDTAIYAVKFSSTGAIQWQETVSGATGGSIQGPLSDGSILLEGRTSLYGPGQGPHVWVLDLDAVNGAILWQKVYGGGGQDYGDVVPDPSDSGLLLSGWSTSYGAGGQDLWIAQLDLSGNILSQEVIGGPGNDTGVAYPDPAGGYLALGVTMGANSQEEYSWVVKLDQALSLVWQDAIGQQLPANSLLSFSVPNRLTNGDLLVDGFLFSYGQLPSPPTYQSWDFEMDPSGNLGYDCPNVTPGGFTGQWVYAPATNTQATITAGDLATSSTLFTVEAGSLATTPQPLVFADLCSGSPGALTATASANVTSGAAPLTVQFTGTASGGTPPYAYAWTFGDNSVPSSAPNPTHTYTQPGTYSVTLQVTDSTGATSTDSHLSIAVTGSPTLGVTASAS